MPGPPYWSEQRFDINFSISEQRQLRSASAAFHARLERAAQAAVDTAASEWLELSWQNRSTTASSLQATQHLPGSSLPPMALIKAAGVLLPKRCEPSALRLRLSRISPHHCDDPTPRNVIVCLAFTGKDRIHEQPIR